MALPAHVEQSGGTATYMWLNMVDAGTTVVDGFAARAIHATGGSDDVAYSIAPTNNNVPDLNNNFF